MFYQLDVATALSETGPGQYNVPVSEVYWNNPNAFGGWISAIAIEAVLAHPEFRHHICALNLCCMTGIGDGEVDIQTTLIMARSSTDFWRVEILQNGKPAAVADVVAGAFRDTPVSYDMPMPDARPPDECPPVEPLMGKTPRWFEYIEQYHVSGSLSEQNDDPDSLAWIRESDGRPADYKTLSMLSDCCIPRHYYVGNSGMPGGTVTLSTYFYATPEDLKTCGNEFMLLRSTGSSINNGRSDQRVNLWAPSGKIMATSNQIAYFR